MPQADSRDYEMANPIDGRTSQGAPNFVDSSWPLFAMYSKIAEEEDNKVVERWQKDAEGIIIFTGLFSAAVATMISVSIQDLKPNSQDTSAFYLKQIYLLQVDPNASLSSNTSAVAEPPVFSPPWYAVVVNALWLLSLVISLSCAMAATLVQQWARRYIKVTQPVRYNPHERARVRAFFTIGIGKFYLHSVVEKLLAMVHLSLGFFFLGLIAYLYNTDNIIYKTVILCIIIILFVYSCITVMSTQWLDCPYHTPLSSMETTTIAAVLCVPLAIHIHHTIFALVTIGILYIFYVLLRRYNSDKSTRNWIFRDTEERVEEAISRRSSELDTHVLDMTLDALGEDDTREKFFELIPGFYQSDTVKDLRRCLPKNVQSKVQHTLVDFFSRTLLSNTVTGLVKRRRLATCLAAADEIDMSSEFESNLQIITYKEWSRMPRSTEFGEFMSSWQRGREGRYTQWIVSSVIADVYVSGYDDCCIALTTDHLGIPEHVLRAYLAHGDSVLLALVIHSARHAIRTNFSHFCLLPPLSEFDVQNTLPELQREFCDLWDALDQNVRDSEDPTSSSILRAIHHLHVALPQRPDAALTQAVPSTSTDNVSIDDVLNQPSSYPLGNIPDHRPDSIIQVHDATVPAVVTFHTPAVTSVTTSSPSSSESLHASHIGDSIPHPAESPPLVDDPPRARPPPPDPIAPVESSATTSTLTITHRPSILVSAIPDPPPLAMTCVTGAPQGPQHNIDEGRHPLAESFSVEHGALASPSPISRRSDMLFADAQSCTSGANQSSVIPEHPPPSPATATPLSAHQGTSILEYNAVLDDAELGVQDDSQNADPPTSTVTVTTHNPHSTTPENSVTRELSSCLLPDDPASPHDSDHTQ